jgi:hypothetical protein
MGQILPHSISGGWQRFAKTFAQHLFIMQTKPSAVLTWAKPTTICIHGNYFLLDAPQLANNHHSRYKHVTEKSPFKASINN